MREKNHSERKTRNGDDGNDDGRSFGYLHGVVIAGAWAFIVLLLVSLFWPNLTERTKFFTGNLLNLLITFAVIAQVKINRRQWQSTIDGLDRTDDMIDKMEEQLASVNEQLEIERAKTNPRLRVSKIRIENFEAGQSPIFITTIANDGYIDATGVEIHIGIRLGDGRAFKWIDPQTVTIPARTEESYPLVTGASISEQDMEGFSTRKFPIEVVVGIRFWNGSPTEPKDFCYRYCYRYLPWPTERRPDDVRQFFPCDFNPRLNISLRISGMEVKATIGTVGVVIKKSSDDETAPKE